MKLHLHCCASYNGCFRSVYTEGQRLRDPGARVTRCHHFHGCSGGATVILGPEGEVRYVILKRVDNERRVAAQRDYVAGAGARLWDEAAGRLRPARQLFRLRHA